MTPTRSSLLAALCVLAVTELALGGLASTPASAKDKTSGKYEEHYETLPPDADPGADPNADPGADANAASDVAPAPDGALEPDAAPVRRPVRQERRSRPPENDAGRSDKHAVPRDAQPQPERARTHDSEDRDERRHQRVRAADPAAGFDRDDADRGE
ncbi:MAG: hypothetical protein ABL907_05455, partial [Hyphomicrobium sp.]